MFFILYVIYYIMRIFTFVSLGVITVREQIEGIEGDVT